MGTTKETIKGWFNRAESTDTHMIVVCDTFDHCDYPVFVKKDENVHTIFDKFNGNDMQRVMEVYNLKMSIDNQLNESRAFNY